MAAVLGTQSTVWAQLTAPVSPVGSIPYVYADAATIATDVSNLQWDATNLRLISTNGLEQTYSDISTTPAAAGTINNSAGRFAFSAATTIFTLTNTLAAVGDIVLFSLETADATLTRLIAVAGAGFITFTGNAAATGITKVTFALQKVR